MTSDLSFDWEAAGERIAKMNGQCKCNPYIQRIKATHLVTGFPPSSAEGSKPTSREVAEIGSTSTAGGGAACVQGASLAGIDSAPATENPSCDQDYPVMKSFRR